MLPHRSRLLRWRLPRGRALDLWGGDVGGRDAAGRSAVRRAVCVGLCTVALAASLELAVATRARAESSLRLPWPDSLGLVPAGTYDLRGRRLGDGRFISEQLDDGNVRILVETGIEGGARNVAMALLEPVDGGTALRPLLQSSQSFTETGRSLGILTVDHRRGEGSCSPPDAPEDGMPDVAAGASVRTDASGVQRLKLPAGDRVVNVPLNLLFQPLVLGKRERVDFQIFLCRGGARLWDFTAERASPASDGSSEGLVEVRYQPNLGPFLSTMAGPFLPRLAFWFAGDGTAAYAAHRMSLYAKGPEVIVAREGVPTSLLLSP